MGVCLTKTMYEQLYPELDIYSCLCVQCMWREDCYYRNPQCNENIKTCDIDDNPY